MTKTIYLVLAYMNDYNHYLWVGGKQNDRLADARYWNTEQEAQDVVDQNNERWKKFMTTMEGEHVLAISYKVIPMEHKVYMKQCLIEE